MFGLMSAILRLINRILDSLTSLVSASCGLKLEIPNNKSQVFFQHPMLFTKCAFIQFLLPHCLGFASVVDHPLQLSHFQHLLCHFPIEICLIIAAGCVCFVSRSPGALSDSSVTFLSKVVLMTRRQEWWKRHLERGLAMLSVAPYGRVFEAEAH